MELMQLEMFVAVFEERSVQRAAERVRRTQPAVSLALGKLEWKTGARLIERRKGDYRLTEAGKVLYEYASRILALRNEALSHLGGANTTSAGRLCVGLSLSELSLWLSQLGVAFGRRFPGIRLEMSHDRPEVIASDLTERRIDLAFFLGPPESADRNGDLSWLPLLVHGASEGQARPVWLVQHRVGCSYMAKAFEDMAVAFSRDCPSTGGFQVNATDIQPRRQIRGVPKTVPNTTALSLGRIRTPVHSDSR